MSWAVPTARGANTDVRSMGLFEVDFRCGCVTPLVSLTPGDRGTVRATASRSYPYVGVGEHTEC